MDRSIATRDIPEESTTANTRLLHEAFAPSASVEIVSGK